MHTSYSALCLGFRFNIINNHQPKTAHSNACPTATGSGRYKDDPGQLVASTRSNIEIEKVMPVASS